MVGVLPVSMLIIALLGRLPYFILGAFAIGQYSYFITMRRSLEFLHAAKIDPPLENLTVVVLQLQKY